MENFSQFFILNWSCKQRSQSQLLWYGIELENFTTFSIKAWYIIVQKHYQYWHRLGVNNNYFVTTRPWHYVWINHVNT